jgi:hypothetical protein
VIREIIAWRLCLRNSGVIRLADPELLGDDQTAHRRLCIQKVLREQLFHGGSMSQTGCKRHILLIRYWRSLLEREAASLPETAKKDWKTGRGATAHPAIPTSAQCAASVGMGHAARKGGIRKIVQRFAAGGQARRSNRICAKS